MKSSEEIKDQTEMTQQSSLSEPQPAKLKAYEFKPEEINNLIAKYNAIDAQQDLKGAKKARTELKKKINEIKKVHTSNKKIIDQFKKDMVAYDFQKFEILTDNITTLFNKIDSEIYAVENAKLTREQQIATRMSGYQIDLSEKILNAKTEEEIQDVQIEISSIEINASLYDNKVADMESIKTKLMLQAAGRANEIANSGGSISDQKVSPIPSMLSNFEVGQKYSDAELLNAMEIMGIPGKGWIAMAGSNGFALYQVDDPKAPKSVRLALQTALEEHKLKTV